MFSVRRFFAFSLSAAFSLAMGLGPQSLACAADLGDIQPLVPQVAEASDEPQQSMGVIRVPDGWRLDLFAAEPDVANVVAMDVDRFGRLYVCETFRQNRGVTDNRAHDEAWVLADLAAETVQDRIDYHKRLLGDAAITYAQHDDRIRRLVDTDDDGVADQSTILADGFHQLESGTGASVLANGKDIFYTCIPKLWKLTDADDDGVAEKQQAMSDGYGVRVAFRGHDLHGLAIGMDGRLYFTIGDRGFHVSTQEGRMLSNPAEGAVFRCELDGSDLEVYAHGLRNPQELAWNDWGDLFTVDNNSDSGDKARIVHLLRDGDSGWRMHYQYLPDRGPFNRLKIWEPHHDEQPAHLNPPVANLTDGPSGLAFYPGTGFGDTLKNRFLICDFRGGASNSGIRTFELDADGASYQLGQHDELVWTVLATDVAFGPGGDLFISDWVDGWDGLGKARVYRLTDPEHQNSEIVRETRQQLAADYQSKSAEQLKSQLNHVDRRVRLLAQWELANRGEVTPLVTAAQTTTWDARFRLHGLWGLGHAARIHEPAIAEAVQLASELLNDSDAIVRGGAAQLAEELAMLSRRGSKEIKGLNPIAEQLVSMCAGDEDARVRYLAMMALEAHFAGTSTNGNAGPLQTSATQAAIEMLAVNANRDATLRHAATRFLCQAANLDAVAQLKNHSNISVRRAAVAALRDRRSERVADFLNDPESLVVTEAAMAIHDKPIPVAQSALAALLSSPELPIEREALLRRALSSNFRNGSAEAAAVVAGFAASEQSPVWARIEALDCLGSWASPDPRCRVTNRFRPITNRTKDASKHAASALGQRIDELLLAGGEVREKAIDVASRLGIKKITPELIARASDSNGRPATRAASLTALSRLDPKQAVSLAKQIGSDQSARVILAALSVLGQLQPEASVERFIQETRSESSLVRGLAWDLLAKSKSAAATARIQEGIQEYLAGNLANDVHLNVLQAAEGQLDDSTQKKLTEFREHQAAKDPLAPWLPSLHGGDASAGEKLFFEKTELSCVRCHQVHRTGGEVGPNLTVIGKTRDRKTLLESICLPDARISEGFETAIIADEDGQVFSGIVATENEQVIELIAADGTRQTIEKDYIVARRRGKSAMPAGLAEMMTARQLRDLVAYLASLQVDPRAAADTE